jgi:hypothetical protein
MCFNKKVVGGLIVIAIGLLAFNPDLSLRMAPVLLIAACPLSMLAMSRGMVKRSQTPQSQSAKPQELVNGETPVERLVARRADIGALREQEQVLAAQIVAEQSRTQTPGVALVQTTRSLSASRS